MALGAVAVVLLVLALGGFAFLAIYAVLWVRKTRLTSTNLQANAQAEAQLEPDIAYVHLGVQAEASTAAEAQAKASAQMQSILDSVRALSPSALETRQIELFPKQQEQEEESKLPQAFVARQTLRVTTSVQGASAVADTAVQNGATSIEGIVLDNHAHEEKQQELVAQAIQRAQDNAAQQADAAGVVLGKLLSLSVSVSPPASSPPRSYLLAGATSTPTPIEPGSLTLQASAFLVYSIK